MGEEDATNAKENDKEAEKEKDALDVLVKGVGGMKVSNDDAGQEAEANEEKQDKKSNNDKQDEVEEANEQAVDQRQRRMRKRVSKISNKRDGFEWCFFLFIVMEVWCLLFNQKKSIGKRKEERERGMEMMMHLL